MRQTKHHSIIEFNYATMNAVYEVLRHSYVSFKAFSSELSTLLCNTLLWYEWLMCPSLWLRFATSCVATIWKSKCFIWLLYFYSTDKASLYGLIILHLTIPSLPLCMHTCVHVCTHVCMHVHMCVCLNIQYPLHNISYNIA